MLCCSIISDPIFLQLFIIPYGFPAIAFDLLFSVTAIDENIRYARMFFHLKNVFRKVLAFFLYSFIKIPNHKTVNIFCLHNAHKVNSKSFFTLIYLYRLNTK